MVHTEFNIGTTDCFIGRKGKDCGKEGAIIIVIKIYTSKSCSSTPKCQRYLSYQISREKFEPEVGFEPWTSGSLARRSTTSAILVQVKIFLLRSCINRRTSSWKSSSLLI